MSEGLNEMTYYICSDNESFSNDIRKSIGSYLEDPKIEIFGSVDELPLHEKARLVLLAEDSFFHSFKNEAELAQFLLKLASIEAHPIVFTDYKKKLPAAAYKQTNLITVLSRSASREELYFHLESISLSFEDKQFERMEYRDKYLETIVEIQRLLLSNPNLEADLSNVLELVGNFSGSSQVIIFEDRIDHRGKYIMSQKSQWTKPEMASSITFPLFDLMPYDPVFKRWKSTLADGELILGETAKFPEAERDILETHGIYNLMCTPITINQEFWGFILLANHSKRPVWNKDEITQIRSMLKPIASYLVVKMEERKRNLIDERLRRIFESSDVGLVLLTKEGNIISSNKPFSDMLGYEEEELLKLNLRVFTHSDDIPREMQSLADLREGKISSYLIEKRFIQKGGSIVWVKAHVSASGGEMGKLESLVAIIENISKEKEKERALIESENRYHKISDLSMEGIILHRAGKIIDCNDRVVQITGFDRDEVVGKKMTDLLSENNSRKVLQEKLDDKDTKPYEVTGLTKGGDQIALEFENRIVEQSGESVSVTAIRNIEERRASEKEIRKLRLAIEQSPASIVITDTGGNIEYTNDAFSQVTGYSHEEAVGKNPRILKSGFHPAEYYQHLWKTISGGETWHGIFRNRSKKGEHYWERAVISPIFDEFEHITHYLAIKENITKEKQVQEALQESEEKHRIISELANDFVYSAKISHHRFVLEWSSGSLEKISGYGQEEIDQFEHGWYSLVYEEDFSGIIKKELSGLPQSKVLDLEYRVHTKGGAIRWISDRVKLINIDPESQDLKVIGAMRDINIQKNANLQLDQSKKYLDSIIDNLPIGLQILDKKGNVVRINQTQKDLLGLKDNVSKTDMFNVFTDPFLKELGLDNVYRNVFDQKQTVHHELELDFNRWSDRWKTRKDTLIINEIVFPILREDGSVHSAISLNSDITNRVKAERALKASEMHQKVLLKIIPDLIFILDFDGVFLDVYTEDANRLLMPTRHFIGKAFSEVFSRELSDQFYQFLQLAVETGQLQSYEYELVINDISFHYETRLLVSGENEVIAIVRDITDNVDAQNALRESEEKFRELAERTQDGFVMFGLGNEILYASPNLETMLGIDARSYTNNPQLILKLLHPDDKSGVIRELSKYRKGMQESLDMKFRIRPSLGVTKWIWYRESRIQDENNKLLRYAAVITDITSIKNAEEELKHAKEEAEKASRSKSAFLANISHEIRTPMNAVLGFSDLLNSRIDDPVLKGYLNSIKSSGNTLLNLLNDILDLSKIEAKKMTLNPTPVNLHSVFDEIKHIFSLRALEKGLDYTFEIDSLIPSSLALDELRIKQILLNLVDNAIKFTEYGYIKLSAKLLSESTGLANLLITVEDTGIGIPAHMKESIFESFRQQEDQDKKRYQGTGLGLAITRHLVRLFGGEISLESTQGKGSKFTVLLKDIEVTKSDDTVDKISPKDLQLANAVLEGRVIIIIDGEKTNRSLIREIFYNSMSKVYEGISLEQVIPHLKEKVDLVILELNNNSKTREDLQLVSRTSILCDAALMGIATYDDIENALNQQFIATFKKPICLRELVEHVANHFKVTLVENGKIGHRESKLPIRDKVVLQELLVQLEGEQYRKWESSLKTSSFAEIENFAQQIKHLGVKYELNVLNSFSDVLVMHAKNFDIDNMTSVLKTYPKLISDLKSSLLH